MTHRRHPLGTYAAALLVANTAAAAAAVALNLPSQFGQVGTDAGADVWTVGTALSAPAAPVALLLVVLALAGRPGRWGALARVAACLAAALVAVGGLGELTAEATPAVSRPVLVGAGLTWIALAVGLVVAAVGSQDRTGSQPLDVPSGGLRRSGVRPPPPAGRDRFRIEGR